jgi:hypothetical protein
VLAIVWDRDHNCVCKVSTIVSTVAVVSESASMLSDWASSLMNEAKTADKEVADVAIAARTVSWACAAVCANNTAAARSAAAAGGASGATATSTPTAAASASGCASPGAWRLTTCRGHDVVVGHGVYG